MTNKLKNKKESGFTIIEVLVTSLIFSVIAITVSSIFVQTLSLQRRASAAQKIQDNAMFVLESISREIRVSVIDDQESTNCSLDTLTVTHPDKGAVVYRLNNGVIEKSQGGGGFVPISGTDVSFLRFSFCVIGSLSNDNKTPRVTILTTVQNVSGKETLEVNLQTTVSSRDSAIEFQSP